MDADELANKKNAAKLKKVEELDLFVVSKAFLDEVAASGYAEKLLKKHSLCDWGLWVRVSGSCNCTHLVFVSPRLWCLG